MPTPQTSSLFFNALSVITLSTKTLSINTLSINTLSNFTPSIKNLSINTLSNFTPPLASPACINTLSVHTDHTCRFRDLQFLFWSMGRLSSGGWFTCFMLLKHFYESWIESWIRIYWDARSWPWSSKGTFHFVGGLSD